MARKETKIGELDRRIIIQQRSETKESDGSVTVAWTTFATVWAKKEFFNSPTMASEQYEAEKNVATSKVQYTIRYLSGVNKTMRVNDNSEYFDILAINQVGRKDLTLIQVESKE